MRYSKNPSWELRVNTPEDLNFAVTVRAVCELSTPGLPKLVGAPLDDGAPGAQAVPIADRGQMSQQWSRWWTEMTAVRSRDLPEREPAAMDPPDFEMLQSSPQLQEACRQTWSLFHRWWGGAEGHKRRLDNVTHELGGIPNQLVADWEHRKGRKCRPFRFDIDALAVDSMETVIVDDAYAQLGAPLLASPMAFASWFRSVLRKIG